MTQGTTHKIVFHVGENDPQRMTTALNNANNARSYFQSLGDEVEIEIVANGPGVTMFLQDLSPVAERIHAIAHEHQDIRFSACQNTLRNMNKDRPTPLALLPEARVVPAGIGRLVELQEDGYRYIKP